MTRGEALFQSVFASQPPAFYHALLPLYLITHSLLGLRLTVLCFAIIGLAAAYLAARSVAGHRAGLIALLLLASSPLYIQEAAIVQADMPAVAMTIVAFALSVAVSREGARRSLQLSLLAGAALALAIGIKLLGAVAAVPVALLFLYPRRQPTRLLLTFAGAFAGTLVVTLIPVLASPTAAFQQLISGHLLAGQASHGAIPSNLALLLARRQLPLLVLAVAGASRGMWQRDLGIVAPVAWSITGILAILVYQPLFPHHILLLQPALAITAAVGFAELGSATPSRLRTGALAVAAVGAIGVLFGLRDTQRAVIPNGHDAGLAAAVRAASQPGDYVISDNPFAVALADRSLPGPLVDTSHQRTAAGLLAVADLDAGARQLPGAAGAHGRWQAAERARFLRVAGGSLPPDRAGRARRLPLRRAAGNRLNRPPFPSPVSGRVGVGGNDAPRVRRE